MNRYPIPEQVILEKGHTLINPELPGTILATFNYGKESVGEEVVRRYNRERSERWLEVHHEVVSFITSQQMNHLEVDSVIKRTEYTQGTGGLYTLGITWTDEFEKKYKGRDWNDGSFFDTVEAFLEEKNAP